MQHDAVGVGDLEQPLAPGLFAQGHGDGCTRRAEALLVVGDAGDGEGQDQAGRPLVALLRRQDLDAALQQDDIDGGVVARQRGEAVRGRDLRIAEVGEQKVAGGGDVVDGEGDGGGGDVDGFSSMRYGRQGSWGRGVCPRQDPSSFLRRVYIYVWSIQPSRGFLRRM